MKKELIVPKRGVLVLTAISIFILFYAAHRVYSLNVNRDNTIGNLERLFSIEDTNAKLLLKISNAKYNFFVSDFKDSLRDYTHTLELNPVQRRAWVGITDPLINEGKLEQALSVIKYIRSITPYSNDLHWDLGLQLLRMNEEKEAVATLLQVAENAYWKQDDVFKVFDKLEIEKEYITAKVVNSSIADAYLEYQISQRRLPQSVYFRNLLKKNQYAIKNDIKVKYIELLISNDMVKDAHTEWKSYKKETYDSSIIWNGDFEQELEGRGFGWRIGPTKEADILIDDGQSYSGTRSLMIRFNGHTNTNFRHVRKYIPLQANTDYVLSYAYRSKDITTKNGVYLELKCRKDLLAKSEEVSRSSPWTTKELLFSTGSGCDGASLMLRRNSSKKLDSHISGIVWFDHFSVRTLN